MSIVLFEGGRENVQDFFDSYFSLIECMECGGLDKNLIKVDLWTRLIDMRTKRYEVKVPYVITRENRSFTASLAIETMNGKLGCYGSRTVKFEGNKPFYVKMTLENIQSVQRVVNEEQYWIQRRLTEFVQTMKVVF